MEDLHLKYQREGLNETETQTLAGLVRQYEQGMLIQAQAALLKQGGYDISELPSRAYATITFLRPYVRGRYAGSRWVWLLSHIGGDCWHTHGD